MRKVIVLSYQEDWPLLYEAEAGEIRKIFGAELAGIHHIGSTSVHGLPAKPVIDMMPVVRDISRVDGLNGAMKAIGYEPKGENGLPDRRFFQKGGDARTHHIHIYETGNPEITRHLAFRDYLRAHPETANEYGDLKTELARQFPCNIQAYMNGKERLVSRIEKEAMAWYASF